MNWYSLAEDASKAPRLVVTVLGGMKGKRRARPAPLLVSEARSDLDSLSGLLEIDLDQSPVDIMTLGLFEIHFVQDGSSSLVVTYLGGGWIRTEAGDHVVRDPEALDGWFTGRDLRTE